MTHKYAYLWSKYRPAILKLMVEAVHGPQEYKLSNHEFVSVNPYQKGGYSFILQVYESKAINNIKTSDVAKDLLIILKRSRTAAELTEAAVYEFKLDKHFVLRVRQVEDAEVEV